MNILVIAWNLVRRTIGSRKGFMFYLLLPTVIISAIVGILGHRTDDVATVAYYDADQSIYSEHLLHQIGERGQFQLVAAQSEQELGLMVTDKKADTAILIPHGWGNGILSDNPQAISQVRLGLNEATFILEGAIENEVSSMKQSISAISATVSEVSRHDVIASLLEQQQKRLITVNVTQWRPNSGIYLTTVIGFMLMFMMMIINQGVTQIVEDRDNQTMSRIYSAPVHAIQIALGNFAGNLALGTAQIAFILIFSRIVFRFEYGFPWWNHFIVLECFVLAALGIASAVAGLVRNTDQLGTINSLVMTPTCMIGGCFWPVSYMPEFMQKVANFVPQKWAIEAMMRMAEGSSLIDVWMHLGILLLFAAVLLGFGSMVLKPAEHNVA